MFYGPEGGLSWWIFHSSLRRMCNMLLMDEVTYRCQIYPVGWWCWIQLCLYWLSSCWICPFLIMWCWNLQLWKLIHLFLLEVFVSYVWYSVFGDVYIKVCYGFWTTDSFIMVWCLSLSIITIFHWCLFYLKLMSIPVFLGLLLAWYIFLHPFIFNIHVFLYLKWVSCR